ncbi:alanine racemase [Microbacterium sp. NPDC077184]|uniref:alanine racemase n=1 Tax=Microbacterium sp. NPDC077184 TaxID=3154764 RepID=UPI003435908D
MTARLIVDLHALDANIRRVQTGLAPAELMLVVKNDAYGHGISRVVPRASALGVAWFGAFDVVTAAAVRRAAGDGPRIFVWLVPGRQEIGDALMLDTDIGVGDADVLEDVAAVAADRSRRARVHLKIDTGLHRNGIRPEDWADAVGRARALQDAGLIEVVGIWSHIAEASDDEDDAARAAFDHAVGVARSAGLTPTLRHLAASAAGTMRPEFRYEMTRVGAFCYGIAPAGGPSAADLDLTPIGTLAASVVAVDADADAAIIDIGVFDGLPSLLAGRVDVGTPGGPRRLVTVGEDSRVEGWPGMAVGDEVVIYGTGSRGEPTSTDLAETLDTIGEEIAVRLSPAVRREDDDARSARQS